MSAPRNKLGNGLGVGDPKALRGLQEKAERHVNTFEVGQAAGLDALDGATKDEIVAVGLGPETDEKALTS